METGAYKLTPALLQHLENYRPKLHAYIRANALTHVHLTVPIIGERIRVKLLNQDHEPIPYHDMPEAVELDRQVDTDDALIVLDGERLWMFEWRSLGQRPSGMPLIDTEIIAIRAAQAIEKYRGWRPAIKILVMPKAHNVSLTRAELLELTHQGKQADVIVVNNITAKDILKWHRSPNMSKDFASYDFPKAFTPEGSPPIVLMHHDELATNVVVALWSM